MIMNEQDFSYTLYKPDEENANSTLEYYELQVSKEFSESSYTNSGIEILNIPSSANGELKIRLELKSGQDTKVIHEVDLGILPNYIPKWSIDIEYVDNEGNTIFRKKKNTEQAEIEAEPKPV